MVWKVPETVSITALGSNVWMDVSVTEGRWGWHAQTAQHWCFESLGAAGGGRGRVRGVLIVGRGLSGSSWPRPSSSSSPYSSAASFPLRWQEGKQGLEPGA